MKGHLMKRILFRLLPLVVVTSAAWAAVLVTSAVFSRESVARAQQNSSQSRDPNQILQTHVADGFTIAAVGDLIHRFPINQFPELKPVMAILHDADIRVANCESSIVDFRTNHITAIGDMDSDPSVAGDLKVLGFNLVGRSNNHTFNWGIDGVRETDRRLDEVGIKHAGTGETLPLARQAAFYDTAKGRVGMVDMASSLLTNPAGFATDPNYDRPGRPGQSVLQTTKYTIVTQDQMDVLRRIREQHNYGIQTTTPPPMAPDELLLLGQWFKVGDKPTATYKMNPSDESQILQSIRNGKGFADFLVATMHVHEEPDCDQPSAGSAWKCGKPADFLEKFAHEAIDAGADIWVGTGPHVLLGIEIYKGKPIFYSLGNFTWQIEINAPIHEPVDPAQGSLLDVSEKRWSYYQRDETMEESVIAVSRYEKNQIAEIRLYPIDLGWSRRPADRGVPWLASPEMAQKILQRLQKMSAPYGTKIEIANNIGVIRVAAQSNAQSGK
jgi:poly-gamma-glutamate capsule biosynthesis protein CapA/YwtB (metallophosphatase superfamily)